MTSKFGLLGALRRARGVAGISLLGLALTACVHSDPRSTAAAGEVVAARACAGCHAVGEGKSAQPNAPAFDTLAARFPGAQLERAIERVSRNGHVQMLPIYLTDTEVRALAAYIRSSGVRPAL